MARERNSARDRGRYVVRTHAPARLWFVGGGRRVRRRRSAVVQVRREVGLLAGQQSRRSLVPGSAVARCSLVLWCCFVHPETTTVGCEGRNGRAPDERNFESVLAVQNWVARSLYDSCDSHEQFCTVSVRIGRGRAGKSARGVILQRKSRLRAHSRTRPGGAKLARTQSIRLA